MAYKRPLLVGATVTGTSTHKVGHAHCEECGACLIHMTKAMHRCYQEPNRDILGVMALDISRNYGNDKNARWANTLPPGFRIFDRNGRTLGQSGTEDLEDLDLELD